MPIRRLLVIDSSIQTLKLLKNSLEAKGYAVSTATDIHSAFVLIRESKPAIILANTRQPELMPFEIFYQLLEAAGDRVSILALSNTDTDEERQIAREAGFTGFIPKPIQLRSLLASIKATLDGRKRPDRSEERYSMGVDLLIHVLDDRGRIVDTERTVSENLSRRGACLLTLTSLDVGDTITVSTLDNSFHSRAIVRGTYLGSDRIRRINIEFIDEKWHDELLVNFDLE
jgi:DNA-binding response OmpR family regulator